MPLEVGIETDASRFTAFAQQFGMAVAGGMATPSILHGFENAQAIYLGAMREKFQSNSRGGGDWPDLAPSTKLKRFYEAGGRFKRQKGVTHADRLRQVASLPFPILYISGAFYTSLYPGSLDNIFQNSEDSVSAGTQVFHANIHQLGGKRIPQRRILTEPTEQLLARMAQPILAGYRQLINEITGVSVTAGVLIAA